MLGFGNSHIKRCLAKLHKNAEQGAALGIGLRCAPANPVSLFEFGDALYIYSFEIMILVRVKAKSLLCYWAVRDVGIGMAQIARRLNLSLAGVSQSVKRGETIVQQKGYNLIDS